jgi:hypothetical protein
MSTGENACVSRAKSVKILVFSSPTNYMLTSYGISLLNWGVFYKFFYTGQ